VCVCVCLCLCVCVCVSVWVVVWGCGCVGVCVESLLVSHGPAMYVTVRRLRVRCRRAAFFLEWLPGALSRPTFAVARYGHAHEFH
jgi:hypothetical protein